MNRFLRCAAAAALILLAALAGAYILRGSWAPSLLRDALRGLAEQEGLTLSLGDVAGNYLTSLELHDLEVSQAIDQGPLAAARIARLQLRYSPWDLAQGIEPFLAGLGVTAEGIAVELDLTRASPREEEVADQPTGGLPTLPVLPAHLPLVVLGDAALTVKGPGYQVQLQGVRVRTKSVEPEGVTPLAVTAERLAWRHPALRDGAVTLAAELAYHPRELSIRNLDLNGQRVVRGARLGLDDLPRSLPFQSTLALADGHAETSGHLTPEALEIEVELANLPLQALFAHLADPPPVVGALGGRCVLRLPIDRLQDMSGTLTVELAGGRVQDQPIDALRVGLDVGGGQLKEGTAELQSGASRARVQHLSLPLGPLLRGELSPLLETLRAEFEVDTSDIPAVMAAAGVSPNTGGATLPPHHLQLSGRLRDGRVHGLEGSLTAAEGTVVLTGASLQLPLANRSPRDAEVQADARIELPDLEVLSRLFPLPALAGALQGQVKISGTLAAPTGNADLTGSSLVVGGTPLGEATLHFQADAESITLSALELTNGADQVRGQGRYWPQAGRLEGVELDLTIADVGTYARAVAPTADLRGGALSGHLSAEGPLLSPRARLDLEVRGLQTTAVAVHTGHLRATSDGPSLVVEELQLDTDRGALSLATELQLGERLPDLSGRLTRLTAQRDTVALELVRPTGFSYATDTGLQVESLALTGPVGSIRLSGLLAPEGDSDVSLEVSHLNSNGWLEALTGDATRFLEANLTARFQGRPGAPRVSLQGTLAELYLAGLPFPLAGAVDLSYDTSGIELAALSLTTPEGSGVTATGTLPMDPLASHLLLTGPLQLDALLDIPDLSPLGHLLPGGQETRGALTGSLVLNGSWDEPTGRLELAGRDLDLPSLPKPHPPGPLTLECRAVLGQGQATLETLRLRGPALQLEVAGNWHGMPSTADLVQGGATDLGRIDLQGRFEIPSLGWLSEGVPTLRRLRGSADGDLHIAGPVGAPEVRGTLRVLDGEVNINGPTPSIQALSLYLSATAEGVILEQLHGELGGGPFEGAGSLTFNNATDGDRLVADLHLRGQDLLLFRDDGIKIRADSDLRVQGPLRALEITGEIGLTDSRYVKNVDFLGALRSSSPPSGGGVGEFSFPNPPLGDARIDLKVTSKRPFRVRNNLASLDLRPELRVSGTGALPVIQGEVYLDPGRIALPAGPLRLESGTVRFLKTEPGRPQLNIQASSRLSGYDISMQVEGPYDEPVVTLSSSPPLPNDELLLLILTGTTPRSATEDGSANQSSLRIASYLGKGLLSTLLGADSTESDASIMERFELEVGRGLTQKGEETLEASFLLGEGVLREGDQVYLRGERDVYDAYNSGVRIVFRFP